MSRSHSLSTLSEREWDQAWQSEQSALDRLSQRGSWLPNVVEVRSWGALRWTSGQPSHAASTGVAVAETFAVVRPDLDDRGARQQIFEALRERPPVRRIFGFGFREYHLRGAAFGAAAGAVIVAAVAAVLGFGLYLVIGAAVLGVLVGFGLGTALSHSQARREQQAVLGNTRRVRTVTGRFAPPAWIRLAESATAVERHLAGDMSDPAVKTRTAVHEALWEAAGLLLSRSDHTGVEHLADQMERLAEADRS